MRTLRVLVVALAMLSVCSVASAQEFFEDFESYAPGSEIHGQGGWAGWDNAAGAGAPVSDAFAYSGSNSIEIVSSADLVHMFDVAGGQWVLTAWQYIPSGGAGATWCIFQNTYSHGGTKDWSAQLQFDLDANTITSEYDSAVSEPIVYDEWIELKLVIDLDENTVDEYYNGEFLSTHQWDDDNNGTIGAVDLYADGASSIYYDDFLLETLAESQLRAYRAMKPNPTPSAVDLPRDVTLAWTPGTGITRHDVYFGTSYNDVNTADRSNPMDMLASQGQAEATFDPEGLLEFGQTYYWRIDEVNAAPDNTIFKGSVWSLTTEPFAYPVEGIIVTSNTTPDGGAIPENTVNGSGLNENDEHSTVAEDMWLGVPDGADSPYIQFEFDRVYKLHEMLVWNYNGEFEPILAFGIKEVAVEYSEDEQTWTVLGDVTLAQGTAQATYTANTTVDFAGVGVKFVRLTVNSSYGTFGKYGLSEVRFLYIPAQAREPEPADGFANANPGGIASWRAGREAASHEIYLSTDEAAVAEGTALAATVADSSYPLGDLDLEYGVTYYWKVNEVNNAEATSTWEGNVWSFMTAEFAVVEDFESYTDDEGSRIYETWVDGYEVDGNGSQVGNLGAPFAEQTIVNSGGQSMPMFYDNTGATSSEAEMTLVQDWTANGIKTLALYFHGDVDNSGQLYLKINGTKVAYDGDASDIASILWRPWNIDLSAVDGNLSSVRSLTIGVEGAGAKGVVYIDDIRLYPKELEYLVPTEPDSANLAGHWDFDGNSGTVATDVSGNGNNGTIVDATRQTGKAGSALSFNGASAYVSIPAAAWSTIDQQATAAVWMYVDSSVTQSPFTFAAFQDPANGSTRVMSTHMIWGDGNLYFDTGGDAGGYDRISKAATTADYADDWIHWAFVKNADTGEQKIYRNGLIWHMGTDLTKSMTGVTVFTLGSQVDGTAFWNGMMDDFRLYNKELTQEEILWLAGKTEATPKPF